MPLFGKSEEQKAAEAQHMQFLRGMSDGTVELASLGEKLSSTAAAAGIKQGKEAKLIDQAFRGLVERMLNNGTFSLRRKSKSSSPPGKP